MVLVRYQTPVPGSVCAVSYHCANHIGEMLNFCLIYDSSIFCDVNTTITYQQSRQLKVGTMVCP